MTDAQEYRAYLSSVAPTLEAALDDRDCSLLADPDVYSIAGEILHQHIEEGQSTFTVAQLQQDVGWSASAETAQSRLETLEDVGFVQHKETGRRHEYVLAQPVSSWRPYFGLSDHPSRAIREQVISPLTAQSRHIMALIVSVGLFVRQQIQTVSIIWPILAGLLPASTPAALIRYQWRWATRGALCLIGTAVMVSVETTFTRVSGVVLLLCGWWYVSLTGAMWAVRHLQPVHTAFWDLRSQ
jgi:hypothetical protein